MTDFKVLVKYNGEEWGWSVEAIFPEHEYEPVVFMYGQSPEHILRVLANHLETWRLAFGKYPNWKEHVPEAYWYLKELFECDR